jgi:hypothetical protein
LIYYGPNVVDQFHRAAEYAYQILRGEKPADLPVLFFKWGAVLRSAAVHGGAMMQVLSDGDWTAGPRNSLVPLLAAAIVGSAILVWGNAPVAGQTRHENKFDPAKLTWQEYRREDFGFRVEVPGEPMVMINRSPEQWPKETFVEVMFDRVTFGMTIWDYPRRGSMTAQQANETLDHIARGFQSTYGVEPKVNRFTMNGAPGREDIFEFTDSTIQYRAVVHGGRVIQIAFARELPDVDIKPAGERFLRSFTLLPPRF